MKAFLLKTLCFISVFCLFAFNAKADVVAYDANGQYLGIVMDYGTGSWDDNLRLFMPKFNAFYEIGGDSMSDSNDFGVEKETSETVYYETNDCSGVAYSNVTGSAMRVDATSFITRYEDQTYKKVDFSDPKTFIASSSQFFGSSGAGTCQQLTDGEQKTYYPLVVVEMPFKEPIAWPLKFEHSSLDINGDGRTGLEEAIFSLKVASGLEGN